jgi:hypothetical protein
VQLAVLASVLFSQGALARVIYGQDHRLEVSEASAFQQKLARSAATMISVQEMTSDASKPGLVQLNQKTLKEWLESVDLEKGEKKFFSSKIIKSATAENTFCEGERFVDQVNPGMCSGFLIAPDLVITAGHCVEVPSFCSEYRWVFGFQVDPVTKKAGVDVKSDDIYKCKKVVSNALSVPLGLDYAIVQLDRAVSDREPVEIRNDDRSQDGTALFVIGNPSGLPLKVAGGANIRDNNHPFYFNANLDTFQGNSGSAVFNAETGVVEGILVRGEEDFVPNQAKMCMEANRCPDDKCRGEDVNRLTAIPEIGMQKALNRAAESGDLKNLEKILKLNLWVDFYGKDGVSALMKAAQAGKNKAMEMLIAKGADINLKDASGNTPVLHAAKSLKLAAVKFLINAGADKNIVNAEGESVLSAFIKSGNKKAVRVLISLGVENKVTANNN